MSHDSELLRRYAEENSEAAFAELVERNIGLVYAAAVRQVGDAHRAKDVVQSVFTDLAHKAASLRRHPALLSWLFTSTRYAARNSARTEWRRRQREMEAHLMQELASSAADTEWQRLRPVLDGALCALRDRERETVLLRYFRGLSFAEVGEALNMHEDAARQCVNRALDKLRHALERRGVESTSAALALALANNVSATAPAGLSNAVTATALTATVASTGAFLPALLSFMIGNKVLIGVGAIMLLGGVAYTMNRASVANPLPAALPAASLAEAPASESRTEPQSTARPETNSNPSADGIAIPSAIGSAPLAKGATIASASKQLTDEQKARQEARREERQEARRAARRIDNLRQTAERRLAPLFDQLDLPAEKREKLVQLVMNDHEGGIDYAAANARMGRDITASPDEYFDAGWAVRRDLLVDVKALLGEEGYAAFLANDLTVRQAAVVEHLQRRLTPVSEPLTEQQSQQLIALFKERHTFVVHDDIIASAQDFLSPAQLEELKTEQQRQQAGVMKPPVQRAIKKNLPSVPSP